MRKTLLALAAGVVLAGPSFAADPGWPEYGGDAGGQRFSQAHQITRANVGTLAVAWTFSTGDLSTHGGVMKRASFENTPILAEGGNCGASIPSSTRAFTIPMTISAAVWHSPATRRLARVRPAFI